MAQIRDITSEALQSVFRRLLPSQAGFGEDLQATNVITPVIDLTASAEGSQLPFSLQTAQAHGSNTAFDVENTTSTLVSTTGFYSIIGAITSRSQSSTKHGGFFSITDGSTSKIIWEAKQLTLNADLMYALSYNLFVFLRAGDSLTATATLHGIMTGSTRQVADINGNLVNPSGFTAQ